MEKIVLGGYFGFDNIGDEAILLSQINFLKNDGFEPIVLTYKGIKVFDTESINRYNFFKIFSLKKKFKLFILGGGGLFQDRTSFRSLLYYIFLIYFMKFLRKRVILLNIGIGPIVRDISKRVLINAIKMCDLIILRDKYSYDFLPELKNKFLSSDSTFILPYNKKEKENVVLLSLRNFKEINLEKFKMFIETIKMKFDLNIEFVCFSPDEIKISEYLNLKYFYSKNPIEILEKISKSDFLIGTRYHSIIFSIITETPFIGVVYDIKVKNLIDELEEKNFIIPQDSIDNWIKKFIEYFKKREELRNLISSKKSEFISRAKKGFDILSKFLKNGSL